MVPAARDDDALELRRRVAVLLLLPHDVSCIYSCQSPEHSLVRDLTGKIARSSPGGTDVVMGAPGQASPELAGLAGWRRRHYQPYFHATGYPTVTNTF